MKSDPLEQVPLKFKLVGLDGDKPKKVIGFERWHEGRWEQSLDGKEWYPRRFIEHGEKLQFTGKLDNTGREIYQGDIVRMLTTDRLEMMVRWHSEALSWVLDPGDTTPYRWLYLWPSHELEIVGHVYGTVVWEQRLGEVDG